MDEYCVVPVILAVMCKDACVDCRFADNNLIEDPLEYGAEGFPPRGNTYDARKLTFEPWVKSPNIRRL